MSTNLLSLPGGLPPDWILAISVRNHKGNEILLKKQGLSISRKGNRKKILLIFLVRYGCLLYHQCHKKELLLLLFSSLSTTTAAVVCNRKTTRKEVDKKLKNFVPRVGMCMAVLIIKFQHKIGTHKIHFYPQAKTWRNVANLTFWVTKMVNLAIFRKTFCVIST